MLSKRKTNQKKVGREFASSGKRKATGASPLLNGERIMKVLATNDNVQTPQDEHK